MQFIDGDKIIKACGVAFVDADGVAGIDLQGIAFCESPIKAGVLKTENWDEYDLTKPVMTLASVSGEKVQHYYRLAYKKFYMRPSYVLKRLRKIRYLADVRSLLAGLKGVLNVVTTH